MQPSELKKHAVLSKEFRIIDSVDSNWPDAQEDRQSRKAWANDWTVMIDRPGSAVIDEVVDVLLGLWIVERDGRRS